MDDILLTLITNNKIFASLNEQTRESLLPKFQKIELTHGEILFSQGDPSDNLYLLASGKLSTSVVIANGEPKNMDFIEPGESLGVAGALTNEPRSLTHRAFTDCILYKLPSKDFVELCHLHPSIMLDAIYPVISRSRSLIQVLSSEKSSKNTVIVPANKDTHLETFFEKVTEHANELSNLIIISDYDPNFNDQNMDPLTLRDKIHALQKDKKHTHKMLFLLRSTDTPLGKLAIKKADAIYIAAHSDSPTLVDSALLEKINYRRCHLQSNPELILIHPESTYLPRNTSAWLKQTDFVMHHHVRIHHAKDYSRLLRFIRGRAVGVVLSGGGTRGWAHVGAIKAIRESKIPIDMIGGTSVGAVIAACYAIHESYEDMHSRFEKIIEASNTSVSWRSLTWPIISLFNAKGFTDSQMEVFDNLHIEDLWLPYFCISVNLANNMEETHRDGILWERTRASSSIPGLIPPVLLHGELHLDGGLLNNLPVDVMRSMLGKKAKVIAVELNSYSPDRHKYDFPPVLTFKETLFSKLTRVGRSKYKFPRFVDTFLRALFVGSIAKSQQNALAANIIVNLNLNKFRLLHSNPKQVEKLIEIGYEETMNRIHQWKYE